jgi:hypothetical protein
VPLTRSCLSVSSRTGAKAPLFSPRSRLTIEQNTSQDGPYLLLHRLRSSYGRRSNRELLVRLFSVVFPLISRPFSVFSTATTAKGPHIAFSDPLDCTDPSHRLYQKLSQLYLPSSCRWRNNAVGHSHHLDRQLHLDVDCPRYGTRRPVRTPPSLLQHDTLRSPFCMANFSFPTVKSATSSRSSAPVSSSNASLSA